MKMRLYPLPLLLSLSGIATADEVLQQAESLLAAQKAAEAVSLLTAGEAERAGQADYDYLLGLAWLESGDPAQAIFAFERCLAVAPDNGPCRVQIARAHLAVGETANARAELDIIRNYNPPPEVQSLVSRYLGAVDTQEQRRNRRLDGHVRLGLGHDSNVNSATDLLQVAMPAFGNALFDVNPASRRQDSLSLQAAAAGNYFHRLSPVRVALADAGLQVRSYPDSDDHSSVVLDAGGGMALTRGRHQFLGKLQLQSMQLGGNAYRDLTGAVGQYQWDTADRGRLAAWVQLGQLRYEQSTRDADRQTVGAAWSHALDLRWTPAVFLSAYTGREDTREATADYLAQDFTGLRLGGALTLARHLQLNGAISLEQRRYQADFPGHTRHRADDETGLQLGLDWRIAPAVTLQPSLTLTTNDSNIPLTDYDRTVVTIDVRFDL